MSEAMAIAAVAAVAASSAAALVWLGLGWLGAWRLNRLPSAPRGAEEFTFTPWELDAESEPVRLETADGVGLAGWFLPRPESRRVVIAMHGYRGEMSQVLGISTLLWRSGFNVLLFDFRGRGRSDRAPITMGMWEREDLTAALDWIARRVPEPSIGLFGFSMGAVVALRCGDDPRVDAVVADSAFASQREVLEHVARADAARLPGGWIRGSWFLPAVEWWHRRRGKPPFDAVAPIEALDGLAGTPLLFVHGERDRTVPVEQARRMVEAAPEPKEAWFVPDALHCGAYFVDRRAYVERIAGFLDRSLAEGGPRGPAGGQRRMAGEPGRTQAGGGA
ncbi:MAG: alpha/beta fold hydrolase [Gemmatimonadota bacterium]|nr:alpha/beta fold hydrolase [Gemmatimonadota bacterium]